MPDKSSLNYISFNFLLKSVEPRQRGKLKAFLSLLFKKEQTRFQSLDYIFCNDDYLLGINQQFLQHNDYTDIITFNLAGKQHPLQGEIYISLDRVRENAALLKQSFKQELHRVIFHGALHLCGYKDKSAADIKKMRAKEDYYLNLYFADRNK